MASSVSPAALGGVADPRLGDEADNIAKGRHGSIAAQIVPGRRNSLTYLDSSISFEDYHHWANLSREYEKGLDTSSTGLQAWGKLVLGKGLHHGAPPDLASSGDEKTAESGTLDTPPNAGNRYGVTESEWDNAQRAIRTATWGSIFFLITTDILGPFNVPWAISQMGYGPGFALYTSFGILAFFSALQLWRMFMGLDSTRYPLRNYGDLAFRIYGNWARTLTNVLQSFQFFLNVALIIESNGQGLSQMALGQNGKGFLCFIVAELIFAICGFFLGQIRTLQRLSFLANLAIWLNVIVIIMSLVVVHNYPPYYAAVETSYNIPKGPKMTAANWPPGTTLKDRINGLMNCVFAYGGATLFNELMAEMRRPMDFWKACVCAEAFIYGVYLIMGMVVYAAQGQFTYNPVYQGISAYQWQTLGNAISLVSALIAALLYGNIGIKVLYAAVLRDVFKFPALDTKKGKLTWVVLVPVYWAFAFIIAGAIPQIANLSSFVGAACILQFSYTFPPILELGYNVQKDAILPEEAYDPATGQAQHVDKGWTRWVRGYKKHWIWNSLNVVYFVGALATAGLGIYASVTAMHETFTTTPITPFSCKNPAG